MYHEMFLKIVAAGCSICCPECGSSTVYWYIDNIYKSTQCCTSGLHNLGMHHHERPQILLYVLF